jgi:hypothetical protein
MKLLFTLILIYIIFRLSVRWLFPWLLKRYIKKVQKRFYEQNSYPGNENYEPQKNNNPKVSINYPGRKKYFDVDDVEYTSFEEVTEEDNTNK